MCDDGGLVGWPADPYLKLTLADGSSTTTGTRWDQCGKVLTYSWTTKAFTVAQLKNAKLEIFDDDIISDDDLCAQWKADLSVVGSRVLVNPNAKKISVSFYVLK